MAKYGEGIIVNGIFKPMCETCFKRVDEVSYCEDHASDGIIIKVSCHGEIMTVRRGRLTCYPDERIFKNDAPKHPRYLMGDYDKENHKW